MKHNHGSRATSLLLSVVLVLCLLPMPVKAADTRPEIQIGDYIQLGSYNGEAIVWRCVAKDNNGPLMLSDKVLEDSMPYDATTGTNAKTGSHRRNSWRSKYGSNHWRDSNMRSWLNSSAEAGAVDWLCGNPPDANHVLPSTAAYDQKEGFLNSFSQNEIGAIKTVKQRSIVSHPEYTAGYIDEPGTDLPYNTDISTVADGYDKAYYENIVDKVFLLDVQQLKTVKDNLGSYYIARNGNGMTRNYWLRTPVTGCNHDMRYVTTGGSILRDAPNKGYYGVRPAFYLNTENYAVSSGDGKTAGSAYVITAPNAPDTSISISGGERNTGDGNWDVNTDQYIQLTLGKYYSQDGKYANPTIPVYVIQKPRSDTENMVVLFCAEGYTKSQQNKFIEDVRRLWSATLQTEPYRSMADRFNVYALCTASLDGYGGDSTFFSVVGSAISGNINGQWKNHMLERAIGPAFIDKIHDAHIPETTDPNEYRENDEYSPYYYVYEYIDQFVVLANSGKYFGGSHDNPKYGIHYIVTSSDSSESAFSLRHELGHGMMRLGDEYEVSYQSVSEDALRRSLNMSYTGDPKLVKWKNMLGFRNTYSCPHYDNTYMFNSSTMCIMRAVMNNEFCDVCKLQGIKRMSQLVKDPPTLYVAVPEVKKYTGNYKDPINAPSAFTETNSGGYWKYQNDRSQRLLSGGSKGRFDPNMKGEQIELRTIIQNLSDTEAKNVTLRLWVEHSDGTKAVTENGAEVSATKDFVIPVWSEKSKFWEKGALEYNGSNFDSGLVNCSLVYTIPQDADLRDGDTIGFEVVDSTTNEVLANDKTETQKYADVTIRYELEDGMDVPNTKPTTLPVPVGTKVDWQAPQTMNGYTLIETKGADQAVSSNGLTITYIYKAKEEQPEPPEATYSVEYDWGQDAPSDKRLPMNSNIYQTEADARASKDITFDSTSTSAAKKGNLDGTWTFSGWDEGVLTGNVLRFTGTWIFSETPKVDAAKPADIRLVSAEYEEGQPITALNGETTVSDNGVLTYQWYSSDSIDNFNGTPIDGETNAAFTPKVSAAGTYYYYVIATNTKADATGEKTAETRSNMATITVAARPATYTVKYEWGTAPSDQTLPTSNQTYTSVDLAKAAVDRTFTNASTSNAQNGGLNGKWTFSGWDEGTLEGTTVVFRGTWTFTEDKLPVDAEQPKPITLTGASYEVGKPAEALDGTTTVGDGGTITYQWYQAAAADQTNGTQIHGETAATYTPDTSAVGTYYYYVIATNTKADATGKTTASTTSNIAAITVTAKPVTYTVSYDWGTEVPDGENLPTDVKKYQSVQDAEAAVDKTYTAGFTSNAQKDGKDGTWTFSGWTASVEGTVVKFTGEWTFMEMIKVNAAKPAAITLADASYAVGDITIALDGTTTAADGGEITYQWYEATSKDNQNGTLLEGKTTPTFTPDTTAAGTHFYYVVATNTNADATGKKTAETRSNTVAITVTEKAMTYTVSYDWGTDFPDGVILPTDTGAYQSVQDAETTMDKTYTASSTSTAQKDGKDGTWTFSGWTATVENTVVRFTGHWIFKENTTPVTPPVKPGSGGSGGGGGSLSASSYAISVASGTTNGSVSVTPTYASKKATVSITVKPNDGYELSKLTATDQSGNRLSLSDKGDGKYTFTMPGSKVSVDASFSKIAASVNFRDVTQSDYYYDAVQWAVEKGITEGTSATTFSPDASCTRTQMVTFLWRAAGSPAPKSTVNPFKDVSSSDYYYNAVLWAIENGITTGVSADRFAPGAAVSRAQTVTFLYRANGSLAANGAGFSDVAADEYYANAVAWAVRSGITTGTGNGKFAPNAPCIRGQIVTFLYRSSK